MSLDLELCECFIYLFILCLFNYLCMGNINSFYSFAGYAQKTCKTH